MLYVYPATKESHFFVLQKTNAALASLTAEGAATMLELLK
jgi:hypothetical protein